MNWARIFRLSLIAERDGQPPVVTLDDRYYQLYDEMTARFPGGPPSLAPAIHCVSPATCALARTCTSSGEGGSQQPGCRTSVRAGWGDDRRLEPNSPDRKITIVRAHRSALAGKARHPGYPLIRRIGVQTPLPPPLRIQSSTAGIAC